MPRAGLDTASVVAAGAALADEVGPGNLTMGSLAQRLGVRAPSLYKHVANQEDLNRRIAALALEEAAETVGGAVQGYAGRDALAAAARAFRAFVVEHPGRYAAALGLAPTGPDDPLAAGSRSLLAVFSAVLRGYEIADSQMPHALRMLRSQFHGFATLQAAGGFRWSTDVDESFDWMITFMDHGLRRL